MGDGHSADGEIEEDSSDSEDLNPKDDDEEEETILLFLS